MKTFLLETVRGAISLLYPPLCASCDEPVDYFDYLCAKCLTSAPRIKAPFCSTCSQPFAGAITQTFSCANCADRALHFESAVSSFLGRGVVREILHEFKYAQQIHLRFPVATWLTEALDDPGCRDAASTS